MDANFIVLTDSVGNEPEGETAKFYVLKKVKNMRLIKNVDSNFGGCNLNCVKACS